MPVKSKLKPGERDKNTSAETAKRRVQFLLEGKLKRINNDNIAWLPSVVARWTSIKDLKTDDIAK